MDLLNRLGALRHRDARPHARQQPASPDAQPATILPVIDFIAFTATSLLSGHLELAADRLTDALNTMTDVTVTDATLVDLQSLSSHTCARLVLSRDDLLIVRATGPAGAPGRRYRTFPHQVGLTIGPYRVQGAIHSGPGSHPISGIYHRKAMIPLTEAVVSYVLAGRHIDEDLGGVIVHRDRLTSIRLTGDTAGFRQGRPKPHGDRAEQRGGSEILEASSRF